MAAATKKSEWLVALALFASCGRETTKVVATPIASASASPAACTHAYSVTAVVTGSWFGDPTQATTAPMLVVRLDDAGLGPPDALTVAQVPVAQPFFDADVNLAELCSDEATAPGTIAVKCITEHGKLSHVVVRSAHDGLDVVTDGAAPVHWRMTYGPERFDGACYTLHGLGALRDLEPARAAWGRDVPSARCSGTPRTRPVHVVFDFVDVPGDPPSSNPNREKIAVSIPGWKRDLGVLSNLGGGLHPTRYTDADAIRLVTSDMGTEDRFAYRLGDRLYVVEGGDHVVSTDLPCGAKVAFDVHYRWRDSIVEDHATLR